MDLSRLSDDELFGKIEAFNEVERFQLVDFLIHLGELDSRDACEKRGYSSVFSYLTKHFNYAESDAIRRVRAARAARRFPSILGMIGRGQLHVVGVSMLQPFLTTGNYRRLLDRASRRGQREIEKMVAELSPTLPEPKDRIKALPFCPVSGKQAGLAELDAVQRGSAMRRLFQFAAGEDVYLSFVQARDVLRHKFPSGKFEEIVGEALRRLVEQETPSARLKRSSDPGSRRVPKWVKAEVWRRDQGRCAFIGDAGRRCDETGWLEYDHVTPWAKGGRSDEPENIRLLCRSHNQAEGRREFPA